MQVKNMDVVPTDVLHPFSRLHERMTARGFVVAASGRCSQTWNARVVGASASAEVLAAVASEMVMFRPGGAFSLRVDRLLERGE